MPSPLSLEAVMSRLETQIAFHRQQESFHAEQEAAHRDQRAHHAAELEALTQNLAAFREVASTAVDLASRPGPLEPASSPPPDPDAGHRITLTRMVTRIVEGKAPGEVFGTAALTAEVNQRYRDRLRKRVTERLVSIALRRMLAAGQLRSVREGRPHHEALYARP